MRQKNEIHSQRKLDPKTKKPIKVTPKSSSAKKENKFKRKVILGIDPITKKPFKKIVLLQIRKNGRNLPEKTIKSSFEKKKSDFLRDCYRWPSRSRIFIRELNGILISESCDRELDLADTIMLTFHEDSRKVLFAIKTSSPKWVRWDSENLSRIEERIKYDLRFDGFSVRIYRASKPLTHCSEEFVWKLSIKARQSK